MTCQQSEFNYQICQARALKTSISCTWKLLLLVLLVKMLFPFPVVSLYELGKYEYDDEFELQFVHMQISRPLPSVELRSL